MMIQLMSSFQHKKWWMRMAMMFNLLSANLLAGWRWLDVLQVLCCAVTLYTFYEAGVTVLHFMISCLCLHSCPCFNWLQDTFPWWENVQSESSASWNNSNPVNSGTSEPSAQCTACSNPFLSCHKVKSHTVTYLYCEIYFKPFNLLFYPQQESRSCSRAYWEYTWLIGDHSVVLVDLTLSFLLLTSEQ